METEGEACRCTFLASFKDEMVLFRHEGIDDAADLDSSGVPVLITLPTAGGPFQKLVAKWVKNEVFPIPFKPTDLESLGSQLSENIYIVGFQICWNPRLIYSIQKSCPISPFGYLSKNMYRYEKNMYLKSVLVFLAPTSSNDNSLGQMEQILY